MPASDTIEAQGHLIDSGLLSAIFDKIIEHRAAYEILKFDIGPSQLDAIARFHEMAAQEGIIPSPPRPLEIVETTTAAA